MRCTTTASGLEPVGSRLRGAWLPCRLLLQLRAAAARSDNPLIPGEVFVVFQPRAGAGIAGVSALNPAKATPLSGGGGYAAVVPLDDGETVASGVARLSSVAGAPSCPFSCSLQLLHSVAVRRHGLAGQPGQAGQESHLNTQAGRSLPVPPRRSA